MQIRKTTHNWAVAAAVAAMLAASTAAVRAQDANANPTTSPGTTTTVPDSSATGAMTPPGTSGATGTMNPGGTTGNMNSGNMNSGNMNSGNMSSGSMSGNMSSGSMSGGMMTDYSILSNPAYDYIDLQQAKARGLSDSQIATIAKIAKESGTPFRMVSAAVERGQTFPSLAGEYNLKLADVYDVDKEKQEVANYTSIYESIGTKNGSSGMSMAGGMDTTNMNGGMSGGSNMGSTSGSMSGSGSMSTTPAGGGMSSNMATMDIVDTAMSAKNLTTLVKALQVAGLVETLKGAGPFTVFAPDDKAFSRLPAGQLDALLADPAKLKTILTYHVIPASIMASDAMAMTSPTSPPTVQGGTLQVTKGRRGRLRVNDATVTKADIKASNGVIHIIDRVLMPPMDTAAPAAGTMGTDTTTPPPAMGTTPATPAPDAMTPPASGTTPAAPAPGTTPAPDGTTPAPAPAPAQ